MSWDGSGNFNRLFSWVADKAAGLNISSPRMDSDTNNITSVGFGNCLTRDGQGQPTATLPMAGFRHTGVQNAVARTDYAALNQAQDGLVGWTIAGGSSDAITATYTPTRGAPSDGALYMFRATAANATTTPTFAPDSQTARVITKLGGVAVVSNDIAGNLSEVILRYNAANTRYELLNPNVSQAVAQTGALWLTLAGSPPTGWLMLDDGTFGSATSGSSNSNSAANQALFTLMFNGVSDSPCPLFTSTGSPTTRAGQGTAAAAWAANCRMTLPQALGRALGVAGAGSGLTTRLLAQNLGEETHALSGPEGPTHNHAITDSGHFHSTSAFGAGGSSGSSTSFLQSSAPGGGALNTSTNTTGISIQNAGSGTGHNNMQPSSFWNAIIKQ
jgi:microcystin-dependent protein